MMKPTENLTFEDDISSIPGRRDSLTPPINIQLDTTSPPDQKILDETGNDLLDDH
jgi:hypothetical protein